MPTEANGPRASRPAIKGMGVPSTHDGLLPWRWAQERLEQALVYWVASVRPDAHPHVMPIWGAWLDDGFYFEGGMGTRRARNLLANPAAVVHVEQGSDAVIVEGVAERMPTVDEERASLLENGFAKYRTVGYNADPLLWRANGIWRVRPHVAFGWGSFPRDATRWHFQ